MKSPLIYEACFLIQGQCKNSFQLISISTQGELLSTKAPAP